MREATRPRTELVVLLCCSALVRLPIAWLVGPTPVAGDEVSYFRRAFFIFAKEHLAGDGARAPLNEVVLSVWMSLLGPTPEAMRLAVAIMGSFLVIPVHRLGYRYGGRRVARWAGVLCLLYPNYVAFSHSLWSETIYLLILACGLVSLERTLRSPSLHWFAFAGGLFGALALTREVGIVLVVLVAGWILYAQRPLRPALPRAGTFAISALLIVLPWTIYLNRTDPSVKHFALVTRTSYLNLYAGNGVPTRILREHPNTVARKHYRFLGRTRKERESAARGLALESIRERLPWWPLEKTVEQIPRLFSPSSFAVRRLLTSPDDSDGKWAYLLRSPAGPQRPPPWLRWTLVAILASGVLLVAPMGAAGLLLSAGRSRTLFWLFVVTLVGHIAPTIVTFSATRFRLPCMLIFILGAAWLVVHGRPAWQEASPRSRITSALVALGLAVLIGSRYGDALTSRWF